MLKGIDISNHQGRAGIDLPAVLPNVDFVICKATEGLTFVDTYCDKFIQHCKKVNKPWGFYHFGRNNNPTHEAEWFYNNCRNYFHHGIPILDWEDEQDVKWVNKFVKRIKELTGINPWIYGNPWRFDLGKVDENCGRWIAAYGENNPVTLDSNPGNIPKTDGLVCCWQYGSKGKVKGYSGFVDVNHFYGDISAWNKYADIQHSNTDSKSILENAEYKVSIERK